ncbi:uncharacterized protein BYT42DRAFT_592742 [Radiomyces spectabilis]|uniref:uncharacterized protein n=1 Tax=Radiomyces spectabilis TaxID=64574 RepID=UPI002220B47E|nr:uncharacterized protein BYT42DRAFT_592742 [Radiomyces spectabilis]KAI8384536.1 hypothetical protein BYT42DRAFT_592742 [Radiomyces spectabilis]
MDHRSDTDSDKDLLIYSLHESLQIHKEIVERIQGDKEDYEERVEQERMVERAQYEKERERSQQVLEDQTHRFHRLESAYHSLMKEFEQRKQEYKRMESNFYSHVRSIRATDDDLSTVQPKIQQLLSNVNNFCMSMKSKIDRASATSFIFQHWPEKEAGIRQYMLSSDDDETDPLLDTVFITIFAEKLLFNLLVKHILDQPLHLGISVNESFADLDAWISKRNESWATRLRQQLSSLIVKQPNEEEALIEKAKEEVVQRIIDDLGYIYPKIKTETHDRKRITNIVNRAATLNMAIKGLEIRIQILNVEEGDTHFDSHLMKASAKGKPEGVVFLMITPAFVAKDENDPEHGFLIPSTVFCVEKKSDVTE